MANKTSKSTVTEPSIVFFHNFPSVLGEAKLIFKLILLWEALRIDVEMLHQRTSQYGSHAAFEAKYEKLYQLIIRRYLEVRSEFRREEEERARRQWRRVMKRCCIEVLRRRRRGSIYRGVTRQELNVLSYIAVGDAEEHMMMKRLLLEVTTFATFKYWGPGTLINFPVSMLWVSEIMGNHKD
ncbi:hypothetical protein F2Q70_00010804 [Brassica cretica]|uniref:Uncharacterized protein n=1 Tax=Brassica cretica TaxID=69181 RepID=A0A8S9M525_BRACR|nr:hypothetical protein F2Q68_00003908 [Brassica cretica]KAF2615190.1 hypothetical protein F2Q70_00010804 [Brassica cretica]